MTCKTLFLSSFFLTMAIGASATASASPELAQAWQKQAGDLHERVEKIDNFQISEDLEGDLRRFGRIALKLSNAGTAEHPLPKDLGCIFRGMEEETRVQLDVFKPDHTQAEKSSAKERLLHMLADAEIVGKAAILELNGTAHGVSMDKSELRSCKAASPDASLTTD